MKVTYFPSEIKNDNKFVESYQLGYPLFPIVELSDISKLESYIRKNVESVKTAIQVLYQKQPDLFNILFIKHHVVPSILINEKSCLILVAANILFVYPEDNAVQATVKINIHNDCIFLTDFASRQRDRSFPFIDEGLICYKHFDRTVVPFFRGKESIKVWDTCTGPANPLIFIQKELKKITSDVNIIGTDINPRAIAYGRANLLLNESKFSQILESDLDAEINLEEKFDYIWSNPPFGLSPKSDSLHTYGGKYGTKIVTSLLSKIDKRLHNYGIAQVLTYSLGSKTKIDIERVAGEILNDKEYFIKVEVLEDENIWRYHGKKFCVNPMPIKNMLLRANDPLYNRKGISRKNWLEFVAGLEEEGYTHLYFVLISIYKNSKNNIV